MYFTNYSTWSGIWHNIIQETKRSRFEFAAFFLLYKLSYKGLEAQSLLLFFSLLSAEKLWINSMGISVKGEPK